MRHNAILISFIAIGLLSWVVIWWALSAQPAQVTIDLTNPLLTEGTLGSDPEGVWFTGNTQVAVDRFADTPWRVLHWRWRQASGLPLPVQLQLESRQFSTDATSQWRVVRLLMPTARQHTLFDIQSGTYNVAGDSRNLGVIVARLQVERLATAPWWLFLVVGDYWLLIGAMLLWLWRGRWVGRDESGYRQWRPFPGCGRPRHQCPWPRKPGRSCRRASTSVPRHSGLD